MKRLGVDLALPLAFACSSDSSDDSAAAGASGAAGSVKAGAAGSGKAGAAGAQAGSSIEGAGGTGAGGTSAGGAGAGAGGTGAGGTGAGAGGTSAGAAGTTASTGGASAGASGASSGGLAEIVTAEIVEQMFPHRADPACNGSLFTYAALMEAAKTFPAFASTGTLDDRKREVAAFFANAGHETTGGWPTAPDGPAAWGLCFREEVGCGGGACTQYCVVDAKYPCAPGKTYHGRGPLQLSYKYNYGQVGDALGLPLLAMPETVANDGAVAFETALWFWMTTQAPKPSCHDVMTGEWTPSAADLAAGRKPGSSSPSGDTTASGRPRRPRTSPSRSCVSSRSPRGASTAARSAPRPSPPSTSRATRRSSPSAVRCR